VLCRRAIVLTAVLSLCVTAWAQTVTVRQPEKISADKCLTAMECINLALRNQSTVRQAAAQVQLQIGAVGKSRSELLPGTSVSAQRSLATSGSNDGNNRASATATVNQLIYDFGRSSSLLIQAKEQRSSALFALIATRADVVLNVKQAYYGVLRTNRLVHVFEQNLKAQEEHVAEAQARLDAKVAPKADVLKAVAAAASARVDLVTARNNAEQARVDLNTAMGVDVTSLTQIQESAEPDCPVPELEVAVATAISNRPEVVQARDQVLASQAALKSAKTGNLPSLTTSMGAVQDLGTGFASPTTVSWLLNLQWQPFDSGFTRGTVTQALAQVTSNEESLFAVIQNVSRDVVAARLNVIAAQESLISSYAEVASAQESVDSAVGRYGAGVGIFLEVTDAQSMLLKAQIDDAAAHYRLSTGRAQLEHAMGVISIEGAHK